MLGVLISTVAGRLRIALCSGVGDQTSSTASQISWAKSSSVPVKLSGEYSKVKSVSGSAEASCLIFSAPRTAISTMPWRSSPKTTFLCSVEVEL